MSELVKIELTEEALQRIIDHCKVAENKADDVQDELELKMDKSNPSGTGSFSMNRKSGSTVGSNSHTEGSENIASGGASHAEGAANTASGNYSHAEGETSLASGIGSHAEGKQTIASGDYSHTGGRYTRANYNYQTAIGSYNNNKSNTIFEVGNGSAENNRSNAFEVRQNGDVYIDGDFYNGDGEKVEPFGKAFFVSFTGTSNGNNYSYSCDKTYSQIREQFDAKNLIVAHFYDELDGMEMSTSLVGVDAGEDELNFRFFVSEDGLGTIHWDISIDSTDTITSSGFKRSKEIPYVDSSDVGKVLSVNSNGDYYVKEVDNTPTMSSENLISSGAVWNKLQGSKIASNRGGTIEISDYGMTEGITMYFKPSQDLHGYDKPWAGGAGKNKLPLTVDGIKAANPYGTWNGNSYTLNGVTFSLKSDDGVNVTSISTSGISSGDIYFKCGAMPLSNNTNYILSGCAASGDADTYSLYLYRDESETLLVRDIDESEIPFTAVSTFSSIVNVMVKTGINMDSKVFYPMIRLATETDPTFEPYSNICPIVGQSEATFSWTDSQDIETARTMNFGNIYYGGVCHFDGTIYPDWDYIASYNGETLTGEWISDRDEYTAGTTPTNGAEVAYKTTPTQVRVTPPDNLNLTHAYPIEYNGSMVTIIYQPRGTVLEEAKDYTNQKIGQLVPQAYSTTEEKVGIWIDGTPIYQRTIDCGLLRNSMTKTITTQIVVDKIISIDGVALSTTNIINLPHVGSGSSDGHIALNLSKGSNNLLSIAITSNSDRTSYTGYVTVQYTKPSN